MSEPSSERTDPAAGRGVPAVEMWTPGIGVPKWWYTIWLPVLSVAIALRAGGVLLRKWKEAGREGGRESGKESGT